MKYLSSEQLLVEAKLRESLEGEEWRSQPLLPEYVVSSLGRVMRRPYYSEMPNGGLRLYGGKAWFGLETQPRRFSIKLGRNYQKVSRLVCWAFNGPPPSDDSVCMHGDDDSSNNTPGNLFWGTQKENLNTPKFLEHCRSRSGENSSWAKHKRKLQSVS